MPPSRVEAPLERGQLFGAITRVLHLPHATLTETRYDPGSVLPSHVHAQPMFVFVADGSFDERFDRHERSCGARRLLYRPPGERHAQRFFGRGAVCMTVELSSTLADGELAGADGRISLEGAPALAGMRLYDELAAPTPDTPLVVEELVVNLVADAARRPLVRERRPPAWLATAREMLEASVGASATPVTLRAVARAVGVHRVHLSRTFARHYGCGVGEYVRRLRVHAACAMMREATATGSAVACETGFSDESHMGRAFRQVMRCTPREYRRR